MNYPSQRLVPFPAGDQISRGKARRLSSSRWRSEPGPWPARTDLSPKRLDELPSHDFEQLLPRESNLQDLLGYGAEEP